MEEKEEGGECVWVRLFVCMTAFVGSGGGREGSLGLTFEVFEVWGGRCRKWRGDEGGGRKGFKFGGFEVWGWEGCSFEGLKFENVVV